MIIKFFVEKIMRPTWIINSHEEMGIRVLGINLWYYKWPDPTIFNSGEYKIWRIAAKREFVNSKFYIPH